MKTASVKIGGEITSHPHVTLNSHAGQEVSGKPNTIITDLILSVSMGFVIAAALVTVAFIILMII